MAMFYPLSSFVANPVVSFLRFVSATLSTKRRDQLAALDSAKGIGIARGQLTHEPGLLKLINKPVGVENALRSR